MIPSAVILNSTCVVWCENESHSGGYSLRVASDFLLNLPGLKDALSFLKDIKGGHCAHVVQLNMTAQ